MSHLQSLHQIQSSSSSKIIAPNSLSSVHQQQQSANNLAMMNQQFSVDLHSGDHRLPQIVHGRQQSSSSYFANNHHHRQMNDFIVSNSMINIHQHNNNDNRRLARVFVDSEMQNEMQNVQQFSPSSNVHEMAMNGDDNNTNIYTEPTIIDSNIPNVHNGINSVNESNVSQLGPIHENQQVVIHQNQPQPSDSLTIIGQDLAITLRQGQLTQTLLNHHPNGCHLESNPNAEFNHQLNPQQILYYYSANRMEFLPLCDLLFNIISLAAYFCDVVFDSVTAYTLYLNKQFTWFFVSLFLILTSVIVSQILSYRWYRRDYQNERNNLRKQLEQQNNQQNLSTRTYSNHLMLHPDRWKDGSWNILILMHILFCGVLWRYFKLFAPVNLNSVKREVSQLCILRMIHAFCQAGPMLLLQTYLVWRKPSLDLITDLNIISIFLSLFSICWALSSFNKNIRPNKIHKLVLTWFGVIFQFFWRVGTITSRIVALTVYAVLYEQWLFVVLFLHWFSMFLWLLSPHMIHLEWVNSSQEQQQNEDYKKNSKKQRILGAATLAWIYIFCFINMEDTNSRYRMLSFYLTMFLENCLLLSISMFFDNRLAIPWYRSLAIFLVFGSFLMGMIFMWIYYRFFHIRNLKNSLLPNGQSFNNNMNRIDLENCANGKDQISIKEQSILNQILMNQMQTLANKDIDPKLLPFANSIQMLNGHYFQNETSTNKNHYTDGNIPGVFNCRLNPALKRKKKKPSTIPPLPHLLQQEIKDNKTKLGFKNTLESISENGLPKNNIQMNRSSLDSWKPGFQSKNLIHQIQRPMTNSSVLMRSYRQSPADTFWRRPNFNSARSLSISPSAMLKSEHQPSKPPHPPFMNKSQNALNAPTRNFTDKLDFVLDHSKMEHLTSDINKKKIIRPKPIVQHSINLDSISEINMNADIEKSEDVTNNYGNLQNQENLQKEGVYNFYEYLNSLEKSKKGSGSDNYDEFIAVNKNNQSELFMHRRPPVPGRESAGTNHKEDDDQSSYMEGKKSLLNHCARNQTVLDQTNLISTTMPSSLKPKQNGRHSTKKKRFRKNKTIKSNQKYRSRSMESTATSSDFSPKSDFSSSGDDGDIESDVNHQNEELNQKYNNNQNRLQMKPINHDYETTNEKQWNLYDKIIEDYDEAFGSEDCTNDDKLIDNNANTLYGQLAQQPQQTIVAKYPSTSVLKNDHQPQPNEQINELLYRPRTNNNNHMFNHTKYKRYNTPL